MAWERMISGQRFSEGIHLLIELLDLHQVLDYIKAEVAGLSEACDLQEHGRAGAGLEAINKRRSGYQQRQQETEQM